MRALAKPEVLKSAIAAALISTIASTPRLLLWAARPNALWYLLTMLFLCGTVLWAFVFAWHTKYTRRPLFNARPGMVSFTAATVSAIAAALISHFWFDPVARTLVPLEYPETPTQWLALVLWTLTFTQLCLIFAPFAWLMRLSRHVMVAGVLTVIFGAFVLIIKNRSSPTPLPWDLFAEMLLMRLGVGTLAVYFLLRGGLPLVWWWALLFQSRHLWTLGATH